MSSQFPIFYLTFPCPIAQLLQTYKESTQRNNKDLDFGIGKIWVWIILLCDIKQVNQQSFSFNCRIEIIMFTLHRNDNLNYAS